MPETLVKVKVPAQYGSFEDAHGISHGPGTIVEVTPRVAKIYGLIPEAEPTKTPPADAPPPPAGGDAGKGGKR